MGIRPNMKGTALLARYHIAQLEFRVWLGHTSDTRYKDWLHLQTYTIEDTSFKDASITFHCVTALERLGVTIPAFSGSSRTVKEYSNSAIDVTYADLLDSQISLPARFRGEVPQVTTQVGNRIEEERGKDMLDAIAFLADHAVICSQGKVKAVPMAATGQPISAIPREEIVYATLTPGFRSRIEEFFVPRGYDHTERTYLDEIRVFHADAISRLGRTYLDPPDVLEDRLHTLNPGANFHLTYRSSE